MRKLFRKKPDQKGFTLLETAIAMAIMMFFISGALALFRVYMAKDALKGTQERMERISVALKEYRTKNGHLPCPAPLHAGLGDADFGREDLGMNAAAVPPAPYHCADPAYVVDPNKTLRVKGTSVSNGQKVRIGAVPVVDLGLSVGDVADKWGRRFVYAVTESLASSGTFDPKVVADPADDTYDPNTPSSYDETKGAIGIYFDPADMTADKAYGPNKEKTPFLVFSLGKTGRGGVGLTGANQANGCPTVGPEKENCELTVGNADPALDADAQFIAYKEYSEVEDDNARYDDIVLNYFATRETKCADAGKLYAPNNPSRDQDGCISVGGSSGGGFPVQSVIDPVANPNCTVEEIGKLSKDAAGQLYVCDETPSALANGTQACTNFGVGATTMDSGGAIYVCNGG